MSRLTVSDSLPTVGTVERLVNKQNPLTVDVGFDAVTAVPPGALTRSSNAATEAIPVSTVNALAPTSVAEPATVLPRIVTSLLGVFGLAPVAANSPVAPAQPPLLWGLLAWVRREIATGMASWFKTPPVGTTAVPTEPTDLALTVAAPTALVAAAAEVPAFPVPGAQLTPSTKFVDWLTGNYPPNNTLDRFAISGTDLGIMWDNGIVDNPNTPVHERQVLIAFGDTFGNRLVAGEEWRSNTLFRSSDAVLSDGISVADGQFVGTGPESLNIFAGSPLDRTQWLQFGRPFAKNLLANPNLGPALTLIPTAGISVPTPGTPYGVTQYMHFMAVQQWGNPGQWTTSYSAIATSIDNGESWQVAPQTVRRPFGGNQNFQQAALVRPGDGYVYTYGTPSGRQGAAYVARVLEKDMLDLTKYEYYSKGQSGWFSSTPAGWYRNNPAAATPIFGQDQGACGVANPGNQVSEMSVQYNSYLKKYVVLHGDQFNNIVMRTADKPEGTWSAAKVLTPQQGGGIYAPYMHPWSPSTLGTGTDLYWTLSLWNEYNVMLMRTDLTKV